MAPKPTCEHIHSCLIVVSHTPVSSFPQNLVEVHNPKNAEEPLPQSCLREILPILLTVAYVDT